MILKALRRILALAFVFLMANGCEGIWPAHQGFQSDYNEAYLNKAATKQVLNILALKNPLFLVHPQQGLEYDLLKKFAADQGYQLKIRLARSEKALSEALLLKQADLAAGRLDVDRSVENKVLSTPAYDQFGNVQYGFWLNPDDTQLNYAFAKWLQKVSRSGELIRIRDRYLSYRSSLSTRDVENFQTALVEELPYLRSLFNHVAKDFSLDWKLVAAVAFQESHWQNEARSFTGVRGIMMLTEDTAAHLDVQDRADLHQSLWGGAKYLRELIEDQPRFLSARERLILALISYNVGPAHLMDLQKLAVEEGLNPYAWKDLRKLLPLLADPAAAENFRYGSARGLETLAFVQRVLAYYEIISLTRL